MAFRTLAAGRGAGWITDGVAVFSRRPGAYLQACLLVGLLGSLPIIGLLFGLAMPIFYGGLLSLLRRQAGGGDATPGQAFDGFQRPGALARLLPIVLVNIGIAVVFVVFVVAMIGAALYPLIASGQPLETHPELLVPLLPKFLLLVAVLVPAGIVFGWLLMLAIPRAMLDDVPGMQALGDAWSAMWANLLPLIVNLLCLVLVMVVVVLIMLLPFAAIAVVQQRAPVLGALVQVPVMAVFTGAILALYCAIMYQAWREIFGDDAANPPVNDQLLA